MSPLGKRLVVYYDYGSKRQIEVVISAVHQNIFALLLLATGLDCPFCTTLKVGQWNVSRHDVCQFQVESLRASVQFAMLPYSYPNDIFTWQN